MKVFAVMSLVLLAACGADAPEQVRETPAPRDSSVFDPLTGTLDRAQGVEDTLRDSAQDRRRQLEEAEGR